MRMSKIIIGIHGMGNKPPPKTLAIWWKAPIREGLKRIRKPKLFFGFELVYWAHYLHPYPLEPGIEDKEHPLHIKDPYIRARQNPVTEKPSELRLKLIDYVGEQLDKIFLNEDFTINYASIVDFVIHHFFSDLERYYNNYCVLQTKNDCRAKEVICSELANALKKNHGKKIMLIAHSMGSIIAYDVLTQYAPDIPIDTLVTIGSPLGLPIIKSKIAAERKKDPSQTERLKTPENIMSHWYNLSDLQDKIAINYRLHDDFRDNARHIGPVDKIVTNDYEFNDQKNPHKSYGYLRTPEMAEIIADFLDDSYYHPFLWLKKIRQRKKAGPSLSF